jgi:hypothetical protein
MLKEQFHRWLLQRYQPTTTASRIANCHKIEIHEDSLDDHYEIDGGKDLIERLSYTVDDTNNNRPPRHRIPINGNIYNGSATLKQAAKLYFKFKDEFIVAGEPGEESFKEIPLPGNEMAIFSEQAKSIAKQIAGNDDKFSPILNELPLDNNFVFQIKRKLQDILKKRLGIVDNTTLIDLIDIAHRRQLLSDETKVYANTIRIIRNVSEYQEIEANLELCRIYISLFAISGIWRSLSGID